MSNLSGRRRFLRQATGLLTALCAPPRLRAQARFDTPLALPGRHAQIPVVRLDRPLQLTASIARSPVFPGRSSDVWAYRAGIARSSFSPMLRVTRGELVDVTLSNRLGEDTTIHWHGLHVDERNDGSGMHPVRHGADYVYRFVVRNRAGLYWYHAHPHHRTAIQVHQGMAGMLLVEDAADAALREQLGLEPGISEIPLLIQDKAVDDLNRLRYEMGEDDWIGNRVLVNWTPEPVLELPRRWCRLRMLNGSNARTFRLALQRQAETLPYLLIGTDGGRLDRPVPVREIYLAPAQRADVLVDLSDLDAGDEVWLRSLAYDPMENEPVVEGAPVEVHRHNPAPMGEAQDVLRVRVAAPRDAGAKPPARFEPIARLQPESAQPRRFRLHTDGTRWYINGYNHHQDMHAILIAPRRGARETWEIVNDEQSMPHPMHLHGFQFQVLGRRGSPGQIARLGLDATGRTPQDLGWLDTVLVWPGEAVRIAIDFSHDFPGDQTYMFHCHNLEHGDQGMMMNVRVAG